MNIICLNGKNTIQENTIRRSLIGYEEKYYKQIMLFPVHSSKHLMYNITIHILHLTCYTSYITNESLFRSVKQLK